ncbi:MAG: pyridoxal phosphate-dependent aminotransferase [Acidobacteria bacterium]|nr:pyridoxal phosphate-dependent aminotransferase [Acidobacteriota bacterium]
MLFSEFANKLETTRNPLYTLHEQLKSEGRTIVDLVRGNVNEHGIVYPPEMLDEILRNAAVKARVYKPHAFGQPAAREAIAEYYAGIRMQAERVLLTPGASVSYWYCFKLFAEPGDEVLCPQPSYPLFDYIAKLCGVELTHYRLREEQDWAMDLDYLEHQITTKTRAIILISPHNPTGMVASALQLQELAEIARRHSLPIVSDEVFNEFLFDANPFPRAAATDAPLVMTLNGFSKMFALPGMKIGWIAVSGEAELVRKALSALELISDTFLPVNEIAQSAVPEIFSRGQDFLKRCREWITLCHDEALKGLAGAAFVPPKGGFYVTVRINKDEEEATATLLQRDGILVHPGYFYDIKPDHLVMTFVDEPAAARAHFETIRGVV